MYFLNNTQFSGASGPVQFAGADRTGIISINQFVGNRTRFVGQFSADIHRNASERMTLLDYKIQWITKDGLPPSDGTPGVFHRSAQSSYFYIECDVRGKPPNLRLILAVRRCFT